MRYFIALLVVSMSACGRAPQIGELCQAREEGESVCTGATQVTCTATHLPGDKAYQWFFGGSCSNAGQ